MKLTRRQREILEGLRRAENDPQCECDLVESAGQVWFGDQRTNHATLLFFLRHCLVGPDDPACGGSTYYHISERGRRALADPDFDPQMELQRAKGQ